MRIIQLGIVVLALCAVGCSDASRSALAAWGKKHRVKQYSCGVVIGEWVTSGKINETQSDGYYFNDEATGKVVSVSGTVQITIE